MAMSDSSSIILSSVPDNTNEDKLTIYFQSRRRSGGGDVEGVYFRSAKEAIVKFTDPQVIDRVLEQDHSIDGQNLVVKRCPVELEPIFDDSESSESSDNEDNTFGDNKHQVTQTHVQAQSQPLRQSENWQLQQQTQLSETEEKVIMDNRKEIQDLEVTNSKVDDTSNGSENKYIENVAAFVMSTDDEDDDDDDDEDDNGNGDKDSDDKFHKDDGESREIEDSRNDDDNDDGGHGHSYDNKEQSEDEKEDKGITWKKDSEDEDKYMMTATDEEDNEIDDHHDNSREKSSNTNDINDVFLEDGNKTGSHDFDKSHDNKVSAMGPGIETKQDTGHEKLVSAMNPGIETKQDAGTTEDMHTHGDIQDVPYTEEEQTFAFDEPVKDFSFFRSYAQSMSGRIPFQFPKPEEDTHEDPVERFAPYFPHMESTLGDNAYAHCTKGNDVQATVQEDGFSPQDHYSYPAEPVLRLRPSQSQPTISTPPQPPWLKPSQSQPTISTPPQPPWMKSSQFQPTVNILPGVPYPRSFRSPPLSPSPSTPSTPTSESDDDDDDSSRIQSTDEGIRYDGYYGNESIPDELERTSDGTDTESDKVVEDTIEVTNFCDDTSSELLQLYFESKRSGGGNVTKVEIASQRAFITFEDPTVVESVLKKKHQLNNCNLHVQIAPPLPPTDETKVIVKNISPTTSEDCLFLYMENISSCEVNQVEYGLEEGVAMVTFQEIPDFERMLAKAEKKKLEGQTLMLYSVPVTNRILVAGMNEVTTEDTLELYFESPRSHGDDVREVRWNSESNTAIIEFEDFKVVDNVINHSHLLNSAKLIVVPYYEMFGPPKSLKEVFIPKIPDSVTMEIDANINDFIRKSSTHCEVFDDKLTDINAAIDWTHNTQGQVRIIPTLTTDMPHIQMLVKQWPSLVQETTQQLLEGFDSKETKTAHDVWPKLSDRMQELSDLASQSELLILKDDKNHTLSFIGCTVAVTMAIDVYQRVVKEIEEKMKLEATIVNDKCGNLKREKLYLLQSLHLPRQADLEVNIDPNTREIKFRGQSSTVTEMKLQIFETLANVHERELKVAREIYQVMKRGQDYITACLEQKCKAVISFQNGAVQITAKSKKDCDIATGFIDRVVIQDQLQLEPEWLPLLDDTELPELISRFESQQLINIKVENLQTNPVISVIGTQDTVPVVVNEIERFMKTNAIHTTVLSAPSTVIQLLFSHHQDFIADTVKGLQKHKVAFQPHPNGVQISGTATGMVNAKTSTNAILSSFITQKKTIDKPGIRKFILQGDAKTTRWLSMVEKDHCCAIEIENTQGADVAAAAVTDGGDGVPAVYQPYRPSRSPPSSPVPSPRRRSSHRLSSSFTSRPRRNPDKLTTQEGIDIILKQGDITQEQADVLVNTCGSDLKLIGSGGVANAFGLAGGPQLQQYCNAMGRASKGAIVETDPAGTIQCQAIYHAVTPSTGSNHSLEVSRIVKECLQKAENDGFDSVAFPAIGTGNLHYPRDVVASTMYSEVIRFSQQHQNTSIKTVYFVVFDQATIQAFNTELAQQQGLPVPTPTASLASRTGSGFYSSITTPSAGQQRMTIGGVITLEVQQGDITQETTDVIVNCTSQNIGSGGGVTKALFAAGGSQLKQACQQYTAQPAGSVVKTVGGSLQCQNVYHVVNPPSQNLQDSVLKCLKMAEKTGMQSIAFPAIGTGSHGTSPKDCARGLLAGLTNFVQKYQPRCLQHVRITVFQQQHVNIFHAEMNNITQPGGGQSRGFFASLFGLGSTPSGAAHQKTKDTRKGPSKPLEFIQKKLGFGPWSSSNKQAITFIITASNQSNIKSAMDAIDKLVSDETTKQELKNQMIGKLSKKELDGVIELGKRHDVLVNKDTRNMNCLILEGNPNDVINVYGEISEFLDTKKDEQAQGEKAELVQKNVQWFWYDNSCQHMVAFDAITNMIIEDAYDKKQANVSYDLDDNGRLQSCIIDFNQMEERIQNSRKRHRVEREDLHSHAASIPAHWDPQPSQNGRPVSCHQVKLQPNSQEYRNVQSAFGGSGQIASIERIQNPHLWLQYCSQKDKMEVQNRKGANEKQLFHGTGEASVVNINEKGFNRSFSGRAHGTALGNGTYFAVQSGTSMGYAKVGRSGYRHMYYAKVLVGEYCKGQGGIILPPAKNPSNPFDVYDTTVDNTSNPSVFVIFHDTQAYPEYLIKFQ
ncbi:protein mono-ADP-ribosyltransferase PARP14-like [Glandiceps talaboti]